MISSGAIREREREKERDTLHSVTDVRLAWGIHWPREDIVVVYANARAKNGSTPNHVRAAAVKETFRVYNQRTIVCEGKAYFIFLFFLHAKQTSRYFAISVLATTQRQTEPARFFFRRRSNTTPPGAIYGNKYDTCSEFQLIVFIFLYVCVKK